MFEKYELSELKLIYRTLNQAVKNDPTLLDSDLLQDLQSHLQKAATQQNYDVTLHADWENFLNDRKNLKPL